MDVDCRLFSSSLTLREVLDLLFAVGARRRRLAKSLVAAYQVRMNGGIRQVGGVTFGWGWWLWPSGVRRVRPVRPVRQAQGRQAQDGRAMQPACARGQAEVLLNR